MLPSLKSILFITILLVTGVITYNAIFFVKTDSENSDTVQAVSTTTADTQQRRTLPFVAITTTPSAIVATISAPTTPPPLATTTYSDVSSVGTTTPALSAAFSCDFEDTYCGFTEQSKLGDVSSTETNPRRSSLIPIARNGKLGVRLHTEPGDSNVHGSGTWERNDLSLRSSSAYCNEGQEEWWAHSVLFPDDYVFPPIGKEAGIVMDFHHASSGGQANFELQTIPRLGLRLRGYGGPMINEGQYEAVIADPYGAPAGSVKKNVWYDFIYHVKWSSGPSGFMEAWLNGKKVMSYNGPTLYTGMPCYLKLANYHGAYGVPTSVIHDRIIRGTSAAAVSLTPLD